MNLTEPAFVTPSVTVVVLNANRREYLEACLSSVRAQQYSTNRLDVRIVEITPTHHGGASCNAAIRSCDSDFVALLADDTRVDPRWLGELVSVAKSHEAAAVTSTVLDWPGERFEFAGGLMSFTGHPCNMVNDDATGGASTEKSLLFTSGTSALFNRAAFIDAGGFDESFSVDWAHIDLGWRLNLFGRAVVLAPRALTYRRPQDSAGPAALAQRARVAERDALALIYKNYQSETLARTFPAAVALSLLRGLMTSGIEAVDLGMSSTPPKIVEAERTLVAHLIALEDFCRDLPRLEAQRQLVQTRRCRSDADLCRFFTESPAHHTTSRAYEEVARTLISDFRIGESLAPSRAVASSGTAHVALPSGVRRATVLTGEDPKVSIVILTALGATHLCECLSSLQEQVYPLERVEVIVVDNGSAEDPTEEVERRYAGARVIRNATNLGFAAGNNLGASVATGDYLVFLNDDTRAHPRWLRELVDTARRRECAAVASCVLDWSGTRIDFIEGAVNFQGKGFQLRYGAPLDGVGVEERERPLLFACGAAMLVDRAVFVEAGMWDEDTFAYYEDVELGWRLNILGHTVWLAPHAVVYHKHHGTSARWAEPPRLRLLERNSLRMLYGLLESESLERALPPALLLAADRALLGTPFSRIHETGKPWTWRQTLNVGRELLVARGITRSTTIAQAMRVLGIRGLVEILRDTFTAVPRHASRLVRSAYREAGDGEAPSQVGGRLERLPIATVARLNGIYTFLLDLPGLSQRRADFQRRRRSSDAQVLGRFGKHWLSPSGAPPFQAEHDAFHKALVAEFDLAEIISTRARDDLQQVGATTKPADSPATDG